MKRQDTDTSANILLVANWESGVGYAWWLMETFWVTIADTFADRADSLLVYPEITTLPERIANSRIETHELDFNRHDPGQLLKILRFLRKHHIRNVYLSDAPTYRPFYGFLHLAGVRKIVVHDHTPGERSPAHGWRKRLKRFINHLPLLNADHVIAVTDYVHQRHLEVNCLDPARCSVVRNGIEPFDTADIDRDYTHRTFGIPARKKIIVTTGRASYYKGIDFFIRCASELIHRRAVDDLHFLFCGDGPDMADFREMVTREGLQSHFTLAGKRQDIRKILPACDIGFHAAQGEVGYSLSILEYMSAGLATIVPDNPSTRGATENGVTGLWYRQNDVASACAAITRTLDADLRRKLAGNAVVSVKDNYNIEQTKIMLAHSVQSVFETSSL